MTYLQWLSAVLAIGAGRGYSMSTTEHRAPDGRLGHVIYGYGDQCGLYVTATAAEGIERYITPAQFTDGWPVCASTGRDPGTQHPDAWRRRAGRYVPRVPARATSMALEALFG